MIDRKGIVIFFQNKKAIKAIKKFDINITYVNESGRYLAGYCNSEDFPTIKKELKKHRLIRKVDQSYIEMPSIEL